MSLSTLLLLADGRFPAGGHAHTSRPVGAAVTTAVGTGTEPAAADVATDVPTPTPKRRS